MNTSSAFRYFANGYLNRDKGVLIYQRENSRHLLPYRNRVRTMNRRIYMQKLMAFVHRQWHAFEWHHTAAFDMLLYGLVRSVLERIRYARFLDRPIILPPGYILDNMSEIGAPRRALLGVMYSRIRCLLNSFEGTRIISAFLLGSILFMEMVPQTLLEVDPTLLLQPDMVGILKRVVLHQGCQPLDVLDGSICTCTENPVHNQIAEDYQQRSSALTEEARAKARVNALAISLGAAILGVMLNHIGNANLITC
jgi:hypothetical protein